MSSKRDDEPVYFLLKYEGIIAGSLLYHLKILQKWGIPRFWSGTDLISLLILMLLLFFLQSFQLGSGWNLAGML